MSENRFIQSFLTLGASGVLVCGGLLLLTSTTTWVATPEIDPSTPDTMPISAPEVAIDVQVPQTALVPEQAPDSLVAGPETDGTYTSSTGTQAEAQEPEPTPADGASSVDGDAVAAAEPLEPVSEDAATEDSTAESMMAGDEPQVPELPSGDLAAQTAPADVASETESASEEADAQATQTAATDEQAAPDTDVQASAPEEAVHATVSPEPELPAVEMAVSSDPEMPVAGDKAEAATDEIAAVLTGLPPRTIASETRVAATEEVAEVLAETAPAPQAEDKGKAESTEVMAALAPPPPLPRRKPVQEAPAAREAALPAPKPEKPAAPQGPRTVAQQPVAQPETTQTSGVYGPWRPMALAPADKPVVSQVPTARPSGAAYSKMVWSALARHKPRAGQSGSTTVVFAIGATGMLGELRVGRSSGNARIDQLALATVRGAAPFPPPPGGSASFSIRIDLR